MNTRLKRMLNDVQSEPEANRSEHRGGGPDGTASTIVPENERMRNIDEEVLRTVETELLGEVDDEVLRTIEAALMENWRPTRQDDSNAGYDPRPAFADDKNAPRDDVEAARFYRRAAEQGDTHAQMILGCMYAAGQGVPQDLVLAHLWLSLSAARGSTDAIRYRDVVVSRMTPVQIDEAQILARQWQPNSER